MEFSIIVPVYNTAAFLDDCIKSVVAQSCTDFELLLIDDGSTDKSGEICDTWAKVDDRIKVIHQANRGQSVARNAGINAASGAYFLFLDSDDYWLSATVLQDLSDRIHLMQPDVIVYNLRKDFDGKITAPYFQKTSTMPDNLSIADAQEYVLNHDLWTACAWNKVTKAGLYRNGALRFYEGKAAEDIEWSYRLALVAEKFDFVNLDVVGYRQRANSITGCVSTIKMQCLLNNVQSCVALSDGAEPQKKKYLEKYVSYQYATLLYDIAMLPVSEEKKAMLTEINKLDYLLECSNNPKVKLIRWVKKLCGFKMTLQLLAWRAAVVERKTRSN